MLAIIVYLSAKLKGIFEILMSFNSIQFFIFFPVVTILYFLLHHRYRWLLLLIASCIFYMAFIPQYILVLFTLIIIDYYAAILIEQSKKKKRKIFLLVSIVSTCTALLIFKYFNFFNMNVSSIAQTLHLSYPIPFLRLVLPIGLSFHTFQSLSYVIEVYKKKQKAEHHIGIYALYVMFYPQLVAGPIERPQHMLHQFYEKHVFQYGRVTDGLKLMTWGLFQKVVIADRLAIYVNTAYGSPSQYAGLPLIIATVFFAFQIYCDFAGYSNIAIGAAQVMGFQLMKNFNKPYFATSIADFWKRWHISLSSWLRDYIYIPLGGNRVSQLKWSRNILITFLVSGLWHGANWTYIVWGALHGFFQIATVRITRFPRVLSIITTFILVCLAWVFFRSSSIPDAFYIISHFFPISSQMSFFEEIKFASTGLGFTAWNFSVALLSILFLLYVDFIERHEDIRSILKRKSTIVRWTFYYLVIFGILLFGQFNRTQFIYFQF